MAFPSGWNRVCALTIQHIKVAADLTNFPVLLGYNAVGSETNLPTEMLVAGGANAARSDGGDIRFSSDAAGANGLHAEVVVWTQHASVDASRKAEIWVSCNPLTASDVTIYVWYNNSTATAPAANDATFGSQGVWDSNYKVVYHFPDGSSLSAADSTATGKTLTIHSATAGAGKIDGAAATTSANYLDASDSSLPSGTSALTIEGWYKTTSTSDSIILNYGNTSLSGRQAYIGIYNLGNGKHAEILGIGSANLGDNVDINDGNWHWIVGTNDGSNNSKLYLDGTLKASGSLTWNVLLAGANKFTVGRASDGTQTFTGSQDEIRISDTNRSANWITTQFNNQSSPSTFWSVGTPATPAFLVSDTLSLSDDTGLRLGDLFSVNDTVDLSDGQILDLRNLFGVSDSVSLTDGSGLGSGIVLGDTESFSDVLGQGFGHSSFDVISFLDAISTNAPSPPPPIPEVQAVVILRPSQHIWTDAQLEQWAVDAIGQIAVDVNCIWARECIPTERGVSVYTLPAYVRTLWRVVWRGKTLDAESWEELTMLTPGTVFVSPGAGANIETSLSRPLYYAMHPTNPYDIRLYPTPSESFSVAGEPNPYAPQVNTPSCIIDYYREPDTTNSDPTISIPNYILRRIQKAYVAWKAFGAEGKGQDQKASLYYKTKYQFLIDKFRSINEGCFVGKRYGLGDGSLDFNSFRYPRPFLPTNFERTIF